MYVNKRKGATRLHCFNKTTCHTRDQPGSQLLYMGECSHNTKVSTGISKFTVGNAEKQCTSDLSKCKVNLVGGDGLIAAKWMDNRFVVESSRTRLKTDKYRKGQDNSDFVMSISRLPFVNSTLAQTLEPCQYVRLPTVLLPIFN